MTQWQCTPSPLQAASLAAKLSSAELIAEASAQPKAASAANTAAASTQRV
jgi:hypothetical protein